MAEVIRDEMQKRNKAESAKNNITFINLLFIILGILFLNGFIRFSNTSEKKIILCGFFQYYFSSYLYTVEKVAEREELYGNKE